MTYIYACIHIHISLLSLRISDRVVTVDNITQWMYQKECKLSRYRTNQLTFKFIFVTVNNCSPSPPSYALRHIMRHDVSYSPGARELRLQVLFLVICAIHQGWMDGPRDLQLLCQTV